MSKDAYPPLLPKSGLTLDVTSYHSLSSPEYLKYDHVSNLTPKSLTWTQSCQDWLYHQRGRIFYPYLIIQGFFCYASILTFPVLAFVFQDALDLADIHLAILLAAVYVPNLILPQLVHWVKTWLDMDFHMPSAETPHDFAGFSSEHDLDTPALVNDADAPDELLPGAHRRHAYAVPKPGHAPIKTLQYARHRAHVFAVCIAGIACLAIFMSLLGMYSAYHTEILKERHDAGKDIMVSYRLEAISGAPPAWFKPLAWLDVPMHGISAIVRYYVVHIQPTLSDLMRSAAGSDTELKPTGKTKVETSQFTTNFLFMLRFTAIGLLVLSRLLFGISHELLYYALEHLPIYKIMQMDAYFASTDAPATTTLGSPNDNDLSSEISEPYVRKIETWSIMARLAPGEVINFATQAGTVLAFYASAFLLAYFVAALSSADGVSSVSPSIVLLSIAGLWLGLFVVGFTALLLLILVSIIASFGNADEECYLLDDSASATAPKSPQSRTYSQTQSSDILFASSIWYITGTLFGEVLSELTRCLRRAKKSCSHAITVTARFICCCGCCGSTCCRTQPRRTHKKTSRDTALPNDDMQPQLANETYRRWLSTPELAAFEEAVAAELDEDSSISREQRMHLNTALQQEADWMDDTSDNGYSVATPSRCLTPVTMGRAGSFRQIKSVSPTLSASGADHFSSFKHHSSDHLRMYSLRELHEDMPLKHYSNDHYLRVSLPLPHATMSARPSPTFQDDVASEYAGSVAPSLRLACSTQPLTSSVVHIDGRRIQRKKLYNAVSIRLAEHFRAVRSLVFTCATCILMQDLYTLLLHRLWGLSLFESVIISSFPSIVGFVTALLNSGVHAADQEVTTVLATDANDVESPRNALQSDELESSLYRPKSPLHAQKKSLLQLAFVVLFAYIACMALAQDVENHVTALGESTKTSHSSSRINALSSILGHLAPTASPSSAAVRVAPPAEAKSTSLTQVKYVPTDLTTDVFASQDLPAASASTFKQTLNSYLKRFIGLFTTGELFALMLAMFGGAILSSLLQKNQWEVVMQTARVPSLAQSVTRHVIAMQSLVYCVFILLSQFFWNSFPSLVIIVMSTLLIIEYIAGYQGR